jgi:hypothetical protein
MWFLCISKEIVIPADHVLIFVHVVPGGNFLRFSLPLPLVPVTGTDILLPSIRKLGN